RRVAHRPAVLSPPRVRPARPAGVRALGRGGTEGAAPGPCPDRRAGRWAGREREGAPQVLGRPGGLDVGPRETADGVAIDLSEYIAAMDAEGVPFERLEADEIMRRWPAWRLDERHTGLFQADAGLADPSQGNAAHRELARAQGADLREHARVVGVTEAAGEVALELADGSRVRAGSVI